MLIVIRGLIMSNLYKQVRGEWVELSEKEEGRIWGTGRDNIIQSIRLKLHNLASRR